ncbi:MAG: Cof-type HAD-IIB family hydrolase [Bacteroidales bacterium]|nr:Cof-type HAD-IIB family hydrolase [Bacteroidales bacterium]
MENIKYKMVITDLDGTLLNNNREVSLNDMKSLYWLGDNEVIRVIATGRNFYSTTKVLKSNFPIDYLIFSSGAGIFDWKKQRLLYSQELPKSEVESIVRVLTENNVDFMIHEPVPNNHQFIYSKNNHNNPDFDRRINVYKEFATEYNSYSQCNSASQLLVVFPNDIDLFNQLKNQFSNIKIIRTTSPLDGDSIWMEIFPKTVSKGQGIDWLCNRLNIKQTETISVGNDYNDIDMLEYTAEKYVVSNAPKDLKERFPVCKSNQNNGFTSAVDLFFDFM